MTITILFVRHAAHSQLGRVLSGRVGDVPLSEAGHAQAQALARRLAEERLDAIHTSPVRRARETAEMLGAARGLVPQAADALDEIDFGSWSGRDFAALEGDPLWHAWNTQRSSAVPPGGEPMAAVRSRVLAHIREAASRMAGAVIAMVSHADVIRAAVAGILGLSLDRVLAFDIDPASVTRIVAGDWGERVVSLNERCA